MSPIKTIFLISCVVAVDRCPLARLVDLTPVCCCIQAMVGTGEALLNIRARGGPATDGKGAASVPTAQEFDFQSELQKFDKVTVARLLFPFLTRTRVTFRGRSGGPFVSCSVCAIFRPGWMDILLF